MPIQTACPHCDTSYNLPDEKLGKTVRCKKCEDVFTVMAGGKSNTTGDGVPSEGAQRKASAGGDEDDEDLKPRKKKKKNKAQDGNPMLMWLGIGGVAALVVAGVLFWMLSPSNDEQPAAEGPKAPRKDKDANDPMNMMKKGGPMDPKMNPKNGTKKNPGLMNDPMKKGINGGNDPMKKGIANPMNDPLKMNPNRDPNKDKEPERVPVKAPVKDDSPELAETDPVRVNYEKLLLDRQKFAAEVKGAAEYFLKTDPRESRDADGLFNGFKDHPWRGKIAKKLELLIDHEDFLKSRTYLEAYARWVTPEDFSQMVLHLKREGEHRRILLVRIAEFRDNPDAIQLIVDHLTSNEADLIIRLIEDLGGRPCLKPLFPYIWHPDYETGRIALSLVNGFDLPIDDDLYQGPVELIPRLPAPNEELTLDMAVDIVGASVGGSRPGGMPGMNMPGTTLPPGGSMPGKKGGSKTFGKSGNFWTDWRSDARFRQIRTLGWLQHQPLSKNHWEKLSKALDHLILIKDYPLQTNGLICLERWGTATNVQSLKKCYDAETAATKLMVVNVLKRINGAEVTLIDMWPDMEVTLQNSMTDYMLSFNEESHRMTLIKKCFNHPNGLLLSTAREGARRWKVNQETLMEFCMGDVNNQLEAVAVNALRWLKIQEPPLDEKKKADYLKKLEQLTKSMDPKKAALRFEAAAVLIKWGKETDEALIAMLEDPENNPAFQPVREKAMDKLAGKKVANAVPAIAMRYQYPIDRNNVKAALTRMGPLIVEPRLKQAFLQTDDKEKKIQLVKVIELVSVSRDMYDTLGALLRQEPAIDQDLAAAIMTARENMKNRIDLKKLP